MDHPLNRAQFTTQLEGGLQRVTKGYGILQPRVSTSVLSSQASYYEMLYGGEVGIDPYTRSTSDVYQDLFDEGSYIGKGIYNVDVFQQSLKEVLPENRILSHDLIEGCYARSGLLSDVLLYEEYPASYHADVQRRQRWLRGDWQIASWLVGQPSSRMGNSALSRWKILDNLRRSVFAPGLFVLLLIGWKTLPSSGAGVWTLSIVGLLLLPMICNLGLSAFQKPRDMLFRQHVDTVLKTFWRQGLQAILTLIFLPHEAWLNVRAIVQTLWRVCVSHKNLLEWQPSSHLQNPTTVSSNTKQMLSPLLFYLSFMRVSPLAAVVTFLLLMIENSVAVAWAVPVLALWMVSPLLAELLSRPLVYHTDPLSEEQMRFLKSLARKMWLFFEVHVGPENHWLPLDNIQEQPVAAVARRTSPTNIGLSLLANLTAYDFGFISAGRLLNRTQKTLTTMSQLERFQGHFYNWYNTENLTPLLPMYVSTVDSGNLAGHLLTLRPGLTELLDAPIISQKVFPGLLETFELLSKSLSGYERPKWNLFVETLKSACQVSSLNLSLAYDFLETLTSEAKKAHSPSSIWGRALAEQCRDFLEDIQFLMPNVWPLTQTVKEVSSSFEQIPNLRQLQQDYQTRSIHDVRGIEALRRVNERMGLIESLAGQAASLATMKYDFLFDSNNHLLAIGYNVTERRRDSSNYDLLASEARLATFVGIAQGCLPQESWFALGRQLTVAKGEPILLSWSGSMFEYLMPLLVMPTFKNTLLDQTYLSAVKRQIDYGLQRGEFWGISESGFNSFDSNLNYQYRAFGVPGLGLKRGLGEDHVIAPYAAMMALMVLPREACTNLQKIFALGHEGLFGLYEAIDYTASRLARGQTAAVVRSFMAHHQGMGLLSLSYFLLDKPLQRRFESDPLFQATMPLLYERVPKATSTYLNTTEFGADTRTDSGVDQEGRMRTFQRPDPRTPEVQLLSNGRYHVMVTSAGGGYSRWKDIAITRWQEDPTRDNWGIFCYVRDMSDLKFWSTAFQPSLASPKKYEVFFTEGRAEFRRSDGVFESYTEVVVSPEDDIELRRTCLTNRSRYTKKVEVTSYAEVVLATPSADAMHPAFSKLFVQTEIFPSGNAILCSRRPRSISEKTPWMFHLMVAHGAKIEATSYETDRMKFVGRGNSPLAPQAMRDPSPLSGTEGSVLDPIVAIRYVVTLLPEESVTLNLVVGARESRQECLALIDKCQDLHFANRVIELAWTHSQVVLRQLNATETDGQLYSRLANSIIYTNAVLRAEASILARNHRGQSGLWSSAISGDLPIVLVQIKNIENMELIRQLVQAHAYWRAKGLIVDLVIWNEDNPTYRQALQEQIMGLVSSTTGGSSINRPGGIFLRLGDQISGEDRILFQAVARVVLSDASGTLLEQINRRQVREPRRPRLITVPRKLFTADRNILDRSGTGYSVTDQELILQNELGGFTPDGKEYVVRTSGQKTTPAPWVNVMANAHFGTVVSESGQSYTWLENAHEFRLTPWLNDPVSDLGGECFYLRDEETGDYWSPTPLPVRGKTEYQSRHGFGYSIFEHFEEGIFSELTMFVALNAPVKYFALRIRNDSNLARRLSITGYIEWVMGDMRSKNAMHILTEIDPATGALVARNPYNTEFGGIQAFFSVNSRETTFTCDRGDFIGRNGSLHKPAALERISLSGLVGAGLDPCGAIQLPFELISGQEKEFVFTLGSVNSAAEVGAAAAELQAVRNYWSTTLSSVTVNTPDPAINVLCNGWLVYQVLTCRLWARSGYYQSGGAFGARDQLQDVMALVHCQPHLVREHILFAAAHQFIEGDVLHWWHPPSGRGVRTLCSDDFLWLPAAVERYVVFTGDTDILNEKAPFIEGRKVSSDEDSYYDLPTPSKEIGTLYEHCRRAIENGLKFGVHGLSLIGSGDWNDGMNKVGEKGKGESVWLSFFIYKVLQDFSEIAQTYGDSGFATRCQEQAKFLQENIEKHGWDGQWYRRAYFDDGTPLGSSENVECQIDSISQSWSVLSGAADPVRSHKAMASAKERLVRGSVVQLLDPPFDKSNLNPGYIRGYVPGVRENGGQYTHAAVWMAMAFAKMGDNTQASALLKMINPIHHTNSPGGLERYKVEPYVMAADVYSVSPHLGRGGWTWYTGSAGWMYRLILESVLGLSREGNKLRISPCLPEEWGFFEISYRYKQTTYKIVFRKNGGQGKTEAKTNADSEHLTTQVIVDGVTEIEMVNDGKSHLVEIQRKIF